MYLPYIGGKVPDYVYTFLITAFLDLEKNEGKKITCTEREALHYFGPYEISHFQENKSSHRPSPEEPALRNVSPFSVSAGIRVI